MASAVDTSGRTSRELATVGQDIPTARSSTPGCLSWSPPASYIGGRVVTSVNVGIEGITPADLAQRLLKEHKIYTVAIDYANIRGCRITPNLYTTTQELDQFVKALKTLAGA